MKQLGTGDWTGACAPLLGAGLLLLALGSCTTESRPNLLLITLDTTRADYLGCYGSPDVQTPNIDRLAEEGVLFENNIASSQATNPSHSSMMTGLYLGHHRVYDNTTALAEEANTVAEILLDNGYTTLAAVSSRHLNPVNSGFGQGFQTYLESEPFELTAGERNELFFSALEQTAEEPFFAWVHYFDPHGDYRPPEEFARLYPAGDEFKPIRKRRRMNINWEREKRRVDPDELIALYKGEITYLDAQIGLLLEVLSSLKIEDNTLVVLVADHGESMTEKKIYFCHAGLYNQVLQVPLILRLSGRVPAGRRISAPTSSVDILPTILELLGIELLDYTDGVSLVPAFSDDGFRPHEFIISESVRGVIRAVYMDGYKYIKPYPKDWAMRKDHLYRSFTDVDEATDLKEEERERAEAMAAFLRSWLEATSERALDSRPNDALDEKTRDGLRALGYLD